MAVGGGFTGITIAVQLLFGGQEQLAHFVFLALYTFVTVSGLAFVHDPRRTRPLLVAIALQIPRFSSSFVAYQFAAGFRISVGMIGGHFNGGAFFGSEWQFDLFQDLPWGAGVNLIALAMFVLLWQSTKRLLPASVPADSASQIVSGGEGARRE